MGRGAGQSVKALRGVALVALALSLTARPGFSQETGPSGEPIPVPSGVTVRWFETLRDSQGSAGLTLRFRFVAPEVAAPGYDPDKAAADLQALCDGYVLPRVPMMGPQPAELVLDLADRVVPFGEANEAAVQFFEAYSVADGACVWEFY
ncbi:DUF6497 family protein [Rhodobacter maris]|uniref:Acetolactate synthase n=1 Tax=Rhodobacter maris TaxID=446682 RepID=A0A285SQR4_9RHOB|nr:DUF6497 family protein [Rhodobacter maris]SOC10552.1 hypothetical protein SAMN05877831_10885 [Rhodobacter maris]